jgi:hypothetical protein
MVIRFAVCSLQGHEYIALENQPLHGAGFVGKVNVPTPLVITKELSHGANTYRRAYDFSKIPLRTHYCYGRYSISWPKSHLVLTLHKDIVGPQGVIKVRKITSSV